MTTRSRMIRMLLCSYPLDWRQEYGRELATTLLQRPLTGAIVLNVARHGLGRRLRAAAPWQVGGTAMLVWLTGGMIVNSLHPLTGWEYDKFFQFDSIVEIAVGYMTATMARTAGQSPALAALKAGMLGYLPELVLQICWALHLVQPTVLTMDTSINLQGHGITEFCLRTEGSVTPYELFFLLLLMAIPTLITGQIGGLLGRTVSAFRSGYEKG